MKRKQISFFVMAATLATVVAGGVAPLHAALCGKCRDLMFTDSQGKCIDCGGPTTSGALQLCPACSLKRHQCEHCLVKLNREDERTTEPLPAAAAPLPPVHDSDVEPAAPRKPPANAESGPQRGNGGTARTPSLPTGPALEPTPSTASALPRADTNRPRPSAAAAKPKPINPAKEGVYTAGKWRFEMQITSPGTRSEGRWGWLTYHGQKLPRGEINDHYDTPWGPMYWVGAEKTTWGLHGFLPTPSPQGPRQGRSLTLPAKLLAAASQRTDPPAPLPTMPKTLNAAAAEKPQTLEINRSHNGQMARLHVGNVLIIRLPGNPATGYEWQVGTTNTSALRLTVRPQYSPSANSSKSGGGTYTFVYQAVQPGSGSLRLYYVRPDDPHRPRDMFGIGVNVAPAAGAFPTRTAKSSAAAER